MGLGFRRSIRISGARRSAALNDRGPPRGPVDGVVALTCQVAGQGRQAGRARVDTPLISAAWSKRVSPGPGAAPRKLLLSLRRTAAYTWEAPAKNRPDSLAAVDNTVAVHFGADGAHLGDALPHVAHFLLLHVSIRDCQDWCRPGNLRTAGAAGVMENG